MLQKTLCTPGLPQLALVSACAAQRVVAAALFSTTAAASQQHHKPREDSSFTLPTSPHPRFYSPDAQEWHDRLRCLDFGAPGRRRTVRNTSGSPCKPIGSPSQHLAFQHAHQDASVFLGAAAHLRDMRFQS